MRLGTFGVIGVTLAAAMLAGCSAGPANVRVGPTSEPLAASGGVAGTVVDESLLPIQDAEVALIAVGRTMNATTQADGKFRFEGVPVGPGTVQASKFGFTGANRKVSVVDGKVSEGLELKLVAIDVPKEPVAQTFMKNGIITCAAKVGAFTTANLNPCGDNVNNNVRFEINRDQGLIALVTEMSWTPTGPGLSTALGQRVFANSSCSGGTCGETRLWLAEGPSPIHHAEGNYTEPLKHDINPSGVTQMRAYATVPREDTTPFVLAFQQPVTQYITVFYNLEPPKDYTLIP